MRPSAHVLAAIAIVVLHPQVACVQDDHSSEAWRPPPTLVACGSAAVDPSFVTAEDVYVVGVDELVKLQGMKVVTGNVYLCDVPVGQMDPSLYTDGTFVLELPDLERVEGGFYLGKTEINWAGRSIGWSDVGALVAPRLGYVGGDLYLQGNRFRRLSAPLLVHVGGKIEIGVSWMVEAFDLSSLDSAGGFQAVADNCSTWTMEGLAFPRLASVGIFDLTTCGGYLRLPMLQHADNVYISSGTTLEEVDLSALGDVAEDLQLGSGMGDGHTCFTGSPILTSLRSVGGDLAVERTGSATDLMFHGLEAVGGALTIANNTSLTSLAGLAALSSVGGLLSVVDNPQLPTCAANALATALGLPPDRVNIRDNNDNVPCN